MMSSQPFFNMDFSGVGASKRMRDVLFHPVCHGLLGEQRVKIAVGRVPTRTIVTIQMTYQ